VTRFGEPITDVAIKTITHGIKYEYPFFEYEAAAAAHLDLWRWEENEYPNWFKAKVMAWYKLHGMIEAHIADAGRKYAEAKARASRK